MISATSANRKAGRTMKAAVKVGGYDIAALRVASNDSTGRYGEELGRLQLGKRGPIERADFNLGTSALGH
jgi:hypothetical protein